MFCPKCRFEYNPGVNVCPDCEIELVSQLPAEDDPEVAYDEPVPVFESGDMSVLLVAQSMLENEDIPFWLKGSMVADYVSGGGMGLNPAGGPYKVLVRTDDEENAREVLKELEDELKWHREDQESYDDIDE
jgi:hypothetical protein